MDLKDILKNTRKELHLSQEEFAKRLNITRGTLSHLERGRSPAPDTAKKISAYYDTPLSALLHEKVDKLLKLETTNLLIDNLIEKGEITLDGISERAKNSIWDTLEIEIQLKLKHKKEQE